MGLASAVPSRGFATSWKSIFEHPTQDHKLGYTALAADMYGKGKLAMNPEGTGKLSSEVKNNKTLKGAGADFRVILYPGAKHSFTNPEAGAPEKKFNLPSGYQKEADTKSWNEMRSFWQLLSKDSPIPKES